MRPGWTTGCTTSINFAPWQNLSSDRKIDRFWGGTRQEAVIFGKAFGLTAADMNHSFLFRAKNNGTREINYTQDASRMENPDYAIMELIAMYKHCTV